MPDFMAIARNIEARSGTYSGGLPEVFGEVGRDTFINLLSIGLQPDANLLDFGCGALRLGYWLVRFMDQGRYFGIEPHRGMAEAGMEFSLGQELVDAKRPTIDYNDRCDMSVFGVTFEFVVARSIFTHTTPGMMRRTLENFVGNSAPGAAFLASYWSLSTSFDGPTGDDMPLSVWDFIPVIKYSFDRIRTMANAIGLTVEEVAYTPRLMEQVWLVFRNA